MDRRRFLSALAAATLTGTAAVTMGTACSSRSVGTAVAAADEPADPAPVPDLPPALLPPPPPSARVPLPGGGSLTALPGGGDLLALTVDDGASSEVVRLYTQFAKDTGIRLTYFV
ncbi:polysaccharide deacetylase family protein, partial [Rhodococcus erythropolis]